jgi:ABC-type amino acid transport substrate-binding protein
VARRGLGDPQAVEFRQVRTDTAGEHRQASEVDIVITALIHTQEREAIVDFSLPYFIDGHALLIRAADGGAITALDALQGRPVGALAWTDTADALRAAVPFTLTFKTYDRFDAAVAALGRGDVDAVTELRSRLFWGHLMLPETRIVGQYTSASVAFAFPENDAFFADLVNLTFQEMVSDGTYTALYGQWFPLEYPPTVEQWPGTEAPALADAPMTFDPPDTISAIQNRGHLVVAMPADRSPFAYIDAAGLPAGYEVNLAQRLAGRWLGDPTAVSFVTTTVETGKEMVRSGQADLLIGGLRHTRAAELELDFSLTTYWAGEGFLVWAGTPITDLMDLNSQPVAVIESSQPTLDRAVAERGVQLTMMPQPTLESAIALLEAGYVVAVVGDRADMLGRAYATPGMGILPLRLSHIPLALAIPPGDSNFRDLVNLTLHAMKTDGELDSLYAVWFDDSPPAMEAWPGAPSQPLRLTLGQAPPEE